MLYIEYQVKKVFANHTMRNLPKGSVHFSVTMRSFGKPALTVVLSRPPGYLGTPTATEVLILLQEDQKILDGVEDGMVPEWLREMGYSEEDLDDAEDDFTSWEFILKRFQEFVGEEVVSILKGADEEMVMSIMQELCQRDSPDLPSEFFLTG